MPPSLREEVEQRLAAGCAPVEGDSCVDREESMEKMASATSGQRRRPQEENLRGGAASEVLVLAEVSQSSVIVSSAAASPPSASSHGEDASAAHHPGTHEYHQNQQPCRLIDHVEVKTAYNKARNTTLCRVNFALVLSFPLRLL